LTAKFTFPFQRYSSSPDEASEPRLWAVTFDNAELMRPVCGCLRLSTADDSLG
jgi:hypothetical protein